MMAACMLPLTVYCTDVVSVHRGHHQPVGHAHMFQFWLFSCHGCAIIMEALIRPTRWTLKLLEPADLTHYWTKSYVVT